MAEPQPATGRTLCSVLGALSLAAVAGLGLWLVARPIATEDFWFHLKMGETYFTQGLWPGVDPMLFTTSWPPVQHEWLFGVLAWAVVKVTGFGGWRVLHALLAMGTLGLCFALARRAAGNALPAALATIAFFELAQPRLMQARPDLITIPAALASFALLWASGQRPSWRQVGAATALLVFWANVHSLFALQLALLAAATAGAWVEERIARDFQGPAGEPSRWKRLGAALVLGALASLLHPRGLGQLLTFFSSSRDTAVWAIQDEWTPFDPFHPTPPDGPAVPLVPWLVMDALLVLFPAAFLLQYRAFKRRPGPEALAALSPQRFLPAAAALGAVLISNRFLWLGALPLFYLLHLARAGGWLKKPWARWATAGAAVLLAATFVPGSGWRGFMSDTPPLAGGYFTQGYDLARYPDPGVRFLAESGLRGNLYNPYTLGGYLGYRLSPGLKTFIDGRTEHYPPQVLRDYVAVFTASPADALAVLDHYGVDVFFAFGGELSRYRSRPNTLRRLRGAPGWLLVFRAPDHAVYLRLNERNAENLSRVEAYYRAQAVPFDAQRGLDVKALLAAAPQWAQEHGVVPANYSQLRAAAAGSASPNHASAVETLAKLSRALDAE